ncbi:MAG: flagellar hook-associated protein 3 [Bdellovibrionales bacterium RIFOXYC1_FULL_54_43]|nr:MAG: flagellar hook-associated protein 3 [Bdellovibrionales bacterium RIFOXYC1_FULL_54_43]OFZ81058.1 MAG: flagellar hook-associated protein 3 [Bdellovibrionales bacterium RIFOXYD1_FULL_55_31]
MRVTQHTNFDTIRDSIHRSKSRMEGLQQQSATLRKLNTPSDDPIGAAKVLEIRTDKVNNDQFQMNTRMAETFLENTDHIIGELADIVVRAKEIALGQASGASSNEGTRLGVAEEVTQLFQQAVATANRRIGDRYLLGGFKTQRPPVDPEGRYTGDDGQTMVEIAKDVFISSNVPGVEVFNTHPKSSNDGRSVYSPNTLGRGPASEGAMDGELAYENVNVFDEIQNLRIALLTGDLDGVRNTLDRFDQVHSKLVACRAKVGSRLQGLQSTSQALERHNVTNAQLGSVLEDADMAQVVSDLTKEETVFKSALASSQRLIQPTLLDFLK